MRLTERKDPFMDKKGNGEVHMSKTADVAVIGAGASGCMAAVSAAMSGAEVLLIEANDKICRKIYATGNGRCNLTNLNMNSDCYHVGGREDLSAFFERFSVRDHMEFWESRGIRLHDRQGYVYPGTDQASTIAEAFEKILRDFSVQIVLQERVNEVSLSAEGSGREGRGRQHKGLEGRLFRLKTQTGKVYSARSVILAGGGLAGPQYGCGQEMYRIAGSLGHSVIKPLPALVQLLSGEKALKAASGVRCGAKIALLCGGKQVCEESGELQMTDKGISGIPVFQLSAAAGRALDEGQEVSAVIDFVPEMNEENWRREVIRRLSEDRNCMLSVFYLGLVNKKILDLVLRRRGLQAEKKASGLSREVLAGIMDDMRAFPIRIMETGTFSQAQVTSGGVPLSETDRDLQSKIQPGLYLAGELLDVDGLCGGYNLQWAMTSGWIAGQSAAQKEAAARGGRSRQL